MEYLQYSSIQVFYQLLAHSRFKPYYKWNTFNTGLGYAADIGVIVVLNLIINGIPSIQKRNKWKNMQNIQF